MKLAATGRFLAVVPASMLRFPAKDAAIKPLPVELPTADRQIGIVALKNRTLSPLVQLFIKFAGEVARPLAKRKSSTRSGEPRADRPPSCWPRLCRHPSCCAPTR
jgi:hypothetical protein